MHIQEGTNTTLTTCTKMTEEVDRRHGVNGNSSSKGANEEPPVHSAAQAATGGRLKFFKDGKFILELVRGCAREGERAGWVSVPRKTFWPPAAAPPTPPHAAPPCASLSLSDDNSSLHSSPCASHRDHAWKQPTPRRGLSRALPFYYCRPASLPAPLVRRAARRKRRRPFDAAPAANGDAAPGDDAPDGDKYHHMKLKKPYQYHKLRVYKKTKSPIRPKELNRTIDRLREKIASLPVLVNAKLASCRQEHAMVSPRKRILREMERVSLEDQATKRRAKTVPALGTASCAHPPSPSPGPSRARTPNGSAAAPRRDAPKHVSSYSIHSLLSMPDDAREPEPKRSPHAYPPLKTESPQLDLDLSPSPDHYRYRYSALALGSPGRSPTPPQPAAAPAFRAYAAASPYAARAWPAPAYQPPHYAYGYGYAPHAYRAPAPPLWMHYALAPGAPPGPWAPLPHPLLTDHIPKDEPTSDLPLNLSKH